MTHCVVVSELSSTQKLLYVVELLPYAPYILYCLHTPKIPSCATVYDFIYLNSTFSSDSGKCF